MDSSQASSCLGVSKLQPLKFDQMDPRLSVPLSSWQKEMEVFWRKTKVILSFKLLLKVFLFSTTMFITKDN